LHQYRAGSALDLGDAERLFYSLLAEEALVEETKPTASGFVHQYIKVRLRPLHHFKIII
jgi:hypothetical protein